MDTTQEDSKKENVPVRNDKVNASSIQDIANIGGKAFTLLLGIIYICGFLTLNSHFYKYGIVDMGIGSSDYLVAGSIFILYVVTYGLFGGRSIVLMKTWMSQNIDQVVQNGFTRIGPITAFIHSYIDLAFFHCLSAAVFSTYAFGQYESFAFYSSLSVVFIISYTLDISNFDIKHPFVNLVIDLILKIIAVLSFFILSSSFKPIQLFLSFMLYSFYINMVLDRFDRYRATPDRIYFTAIFSAIFFLGSAISFGAMVYGDVSKKIGGGKSIPMEIGIDKKHLETLYKIPPNTIVGNVVYISSQNIYLTIEKETLILPKNAVQWMRFQSVEEENKGNFIQGLINKSNSETKKQTTD